MIYWGWNVIGQRGKMICGTCKSDMSDQNNVDNAEEDGKIIRRCKCGNSYMEMSLNNYGGAICQST